MGGTTAEAAIPNAALRATDGRRHFLALDSLRGLCAVLVALYHFNSDAWLVSSAIIRHAFLFVDFFFVLSGFVIMTSYGEKLQGGLSIARFMGLRAGRLYPLHLAVLAALLALQIGGAIMHVPGLQGGGRHDATGFLLALFLLHIFTQDGVGAWNPASWSISAEFWTYLIFALLARGARRWLWLALILMVAITPFLIDRASDRHINVCFEGAVWRCLYGFSLGALGRMLWPRVDRLIRALSYGLLTLIECAVTIGVLILIAISGAGPLSYACPWAFVLAVLVFAREGGAISRLLKTPPLLFIGVLSYSIYMVHEFVQARLLNVLAAFHLTYLVGGAAGRQTIGRSFPFPFASDLLALLMLATVIGCAYLTFHFVEEPGRIWSRDRLARSRQATPEPMA